MLYFTLGNIIVSCFAIYKSWTSKSFKVGEGLVVKILSFSASLLF